MPKHRHSTIDLVGYDAESMLSLQPCSHPESRLVSASASFDPFIPWHELNVRHRSLTVIAKHPVGHATPPGHLLVPTLTFPLHITL